MSSEVERLKAAARERWGERWTVRELHFADGDTHACAYQSQGLDDDGNQILLRMSFVDDGSIVVSRVVRCMEELEEELVEELEVAGDV